VLAGGVNSTNCGKSESRFSYKFGNQHVEASQRRATGIEAEKSRPDN
jgi:hypothetical protein